MIISLSTWRCCSLHINILLFFHLTPCLNEIHTPGSRGLCAEFNEGSMVRIEIPSYSLCGERWVVLYTSLCTLSHGGRVVQFPTLPHRQRAPINVTMKL